VMDATFRSAGGASWGPLAPRYGSRAPRPAP
jgi:hypothetical protein